jgi:glycosylphosphatidylinositol transamidase
LKKRAGSIQAALNLEIKDENVDQIELKLEGANGKLPNLDLFNSIIRICKSVQFKCSLESEKFEQEHSYYHHRPPVEHIPGIENTVSMLFKQATGIPTSSHGYFLNHRIEALTIAGVKSATNFKRQNSKQNLLKVTRYLYQILYLILQIFLINHFLFNF